MNNRSLPDQDGVVLETFIPVTRFALLDRLVKMACEAEAGEETAAFFHGLAQWRHQEHYDRLLRLKELYLPFSPDRDTIRVLEYSRDELEAMRSRLVEDISAMLESANYTQIDHDQLNLLLSTHSAYGLELRVDRDEYDEILIYFRGAGSETLVKREWRALFRKQVVQVPTFKRLFLLLKLKSQEKRIGEIVDEKGVSEKRARKILAKRRKPFPKAASSNRIYLKLFKNIPQEDLEMMFPNTQVRFRMFDKVKLGITAGGGTAAGVAGAASKVMAAAATANPLALAGSIFGLIGLITRQVMSFFNTRNRYMLTLSKRLYFHSLADNRGALTLLSDRAEEEDVKEEYLLYHFLSQEPVLRSELAVLDARVEAFLADELGVKVDFEIEDALTRLERDGLVREDDSGRLQALPPVEATRILEQHWNHRLARLKGTV